MDMNGKSIFLLVLLVGVPWFYWSEYRPSQIRINCSEYALKQAQEIYKIQNPPEKGKASAEGMYLKDDLKHHYDYCLSRNGLAS